MRWGAMRSNSFPWGNLHQLKNPKTQLKKGKVNNRKSNDWLYQRRHKGDKEAMMDRFLQTVKF